MARTRRALVLWCAIAHGCAIVAPLDDVRPTKITRGGSPAPADIRDAQPPPTPSPAERDAQPPLVLEEDGGEPGEPRPACPGGGLTPCNAAHQCGCMQGARCGLDDAETGIMCLSTSPGTRARGEACMRSSECGAGLQCARTHLCSPYCERDADCEEGERCALFENISNIVLAGSGSCQKPCDPVSHAPCTDSQHCRSPVKANAVQLSSCAANLPSENVPRNASCADDSLTCESRTSCARFGPEVCVPLCRTDADCPNDLPHCYLTDRLAAPGDTLGNCWVYPCDDSTVPDPPGWRGGPVADSAQLAFCRSRCGARFNDLDCIQKECAPNLDRCVAESWHACAAAGGGPCRAQYVAASCVSWLERLNMDVRYENCRDGAVACSQIAQDACSGGSN